VTAVIVDDINGSEAGILVDFFRAHLKQVVSIHRVMFEKLLFEQDSTVGPELAELFQDVGETYLKISERISENCSTHHSLQD
jgi:hypothetical protein